MIKTFESERVKEYTSSRGLKKNNGERDMGKIDEVRLGFETAYIDGSVVSNNIYRPEFVSNNHKAGKKTSLDKGTQRKTTENELPSLTQCTA